MVKKVLSGALSVFLAFLMAFEGFTTHMVAATKDQYISDIKTYQADSPEEAKRWLTDNGYTVIDQNMHQGASDGKYVYAGYKTTNDPDEAITDIRIGSMNQGFEAMSYREFAESLNSQYGYITDKVIAMANKVAENAEDGNLRAKAAIEMLNIFYYEDDTGSIPLFDFLVDPATDVKKVQDILLIATDSMLSNLYTYLSMGCMGVDYNFLDILSNLNAKSFYPSSSDANLLSYYNDSQRLIRPLEEFYNKYTEAKEFMDSGIDEDVFTKYREVLVRRTAGESDEDILKEYSEQEQETFNKLEMSALYIGTYENMKQYSLDVTDCNNLSLHYSNVGDYILACGNLKKNSDGEVCEEEYKRLYPLCKCLDETQMTAFEMCGVYMNVGFAVADSKKTYTDILAQAKDLKLQLEGEKKTDKFGQPLIGVSVYYGADPDIMDKRVCLTSDAARENSAADLLAGLADLSSYEEAERISGNVMKIAGIVGCGAVAVTALVVGVGAMMTGLGLKAGIATFVGLGIDVFCVGVETAATIGGGVLQGFAQFAAFGTATIYFVIVVIAIIIILVIVWAIIKAVKQSKKKTATIERTEMPEIIFDLNNNKFIRYDVCLGTDGKPQDLNCWSTKYWNVLATTKSKNVGSPLMVKDGVCLVKLSGTTVPSGLRPLSKFGYTNACNVNENDATGTQVYMGFYTYNSVNGLADAEYAGAYLSDMIIETGSERVETIAKLEKQGFQAIDYDLTPTWGGVCTMVGYKTSSDKSQAITDIRILFGNCGKDAVYYGYGTTPSGSPGQASYTNCYAASPYKTVAGWSLYYTKYRGVGLPILASSLTVTDNIDAVKNDYTYVPVSNFGDGAYVNIFNFCGANSAGDGYLYKRGDDCWRNIFMYYRYAEEFEQASSNLISGLAFFSGYDMGNYSVDYLMSCQCYKWVNVIRDLAIDNNKSGGGTYLFYTVTRNPYRAITDIMSYTGAIDSDGVPDFIGVSSTSYAAAKVYFNTDVGSASTKNRVAVRSSNGYVTRQAGEGAVYQTNLNDLEDEDIIETQNYWWEATRARDLYVAGPGCGTPLKTSDVVALWADDFNLNNAKAQTFSRYSRNPSEIANSADYRPVMDMRDALKDDGVYGENLLFDRSGLNWIYWPSEIPTTSDKVTVDYYGLYIKRSQRARAEDQQYIKGIYGYYSEAGQYSVDSTYLGLLAQYGFGEFFEQNLAGSNWRWPDARYGYEDTWHHYQGRTALVMVQYTSNYNEAVTDAALVRLDDVENWDPSENASVRTITIDGMSYTLSSNVMCLQGFKCALYTTTNSFNREPMTSVQLSSEPLVDGYATASSVVVSTEKDEKGNAYFNYTKLPGSKSINDSFYILFTRKETTAQTYYNKVCAKRGTSENEARKLLYYDGCYEVIGKYTFNSKIETKDEQYIISSEPRTIAVGVTRTTDAFDETIITDFCVGTEKTFSKNGVSYTLASDNMSYDDSPRYLFTAAVEGKVPVGSIELSDGYTVEGDFKDKFVLNSLSDSKIDSDYLFNAVTQNANMYISKEMCKNTQHRLVATWLNDVDLEGTVLTIDKHGNMADYGPLTDQQYTRTAKGTVGKMSADEQTDFNKKIANTMYLLNHGGSLKAYFVPEWFAYRNKGVTNIVVKSLDSIDDYAFFGFSGKGLTISIMNPDCTIAEGAIPEGATIMGYKFSTAEKYALKYGYTFSQLVDSTGVVYNKYGNNVRWGKSNGVLYITGTGTTQGATSVVKKQIGSADEAIIDAGVTALSKYVLPDSVKKITFLGYCEIKSKAIPSDVETICAPIDSEMYNMLKTAGYNVEPYSEKSGKCGENITWYYTGDTVLFKGTGAMYDQSKLTDLLQFLSDYQSKIRYVNFSGNITSLSGGLLSGLTKVRNLTLPGTLTKIGKDCLTNLTLDSLVIYENLLELPAGVLASSEVDTLYVYSSNTKANGSLGNSSTKISTIVTYEKSKMATYAKANHITVESIGVAGGAAGETVKWEIKNGILSFIGSGPMTDKNLGEVSDTPVSDTAAAPASNAVTAPVADTATAPVAETTSAPTADAATASTADTASAPAAETTSAPEPAAASEDSSDTAAAPALDTTFEFDADVDWRLPEYQVTGYSIDSNITTLAPGCFMNKTLASYTIPDTITAIGDRAFAYDAVTSLTLGNGITNVTKGMLELCTIGSLVIKNKKCTIEGFSQLTTVQRIVGYIDSAAYKWAKANGVPFVDIETGIAVLPVETHEEEGGITWYFDTDTLYVGGTGTITGTIAQSWSQYRPLAKKVVIGYGIVKVDTQAMSSYANAESITIEQKNGKSTLTEIGRCAFQQCPKLKSFTIPASVTKVGETPFWQCTSLGRIIVYSDTCTFCRALGGSNNTILYCHQNSTALKFAQALRMRYVATSRLDLIGSAFSDGNVIAVSVSAAVLIGLVVGLAVYKKKKKVTVEGIEDDENE